MNIAFSPIRSDTILTLSREGDTLVVNNDRLEFGRISEGDLLPSDGVDNPWVVGGVERKGGILHVTVLRPHGANASEADRFPEPIMLEDGQVLTIRSENADAY